MKILLPVSQGPSFHDALTLAIDIARAREAEIHVVYIIDHGEIERIENGSGPGAVHLAQHAAEEVRKRMTEEATVAVFDATNLCSRAGVPAHGDIREGDPAEQLLAAAGGCDMAVAAVSSHFDPGLEDKPGRRVLAMMKDGGIPVLLACTPYRPIRTVVVACKGDVRSERAAGAMTRLSLWKEGCRLILLAVDDSPEGGESRLTAPRNLLSDGEYPPWEEKVLSGPLQETVFDFCRKEDADVVVLGGWGEHRWDNLLGRSVTGRFVEEGSCNLFLYM